MNDIKYYFSKDLASSFFIAFNYMIIYVISYYRRSY